MHAQVHGHYADAGEVAALVASTMASTEDVDMVMTGHSLGRNKLEHLLASGEGYLSLTGLSDRGTLLWVSCQSGPMPAGGANCANRFRDQYSLSDPPRAGTMSKAEIEQSYKISRRIEGEERGIDYATMVFTSTQQEVTHRLSFTRLPLLASTPLVPFLHTLRGVESHVRTFGPAHSFECFWVLGPVSATSRRLLDATGWLQCETSAVDTQPPQSGLMGASRPSQAFRYELPFPSRPQVVEQWGLYDGYDPKLEKVLRYRKRTGRHMPVMNVIPPGLDFSNLKVGWKLIYGRVRY